MKTIKEEVLKEMDIGEFHKELPTEYYKDLVKAISLTLQKERARVEKKIDALEGYMYCLVKDSDKIIFKKSKDAPFIKREELKLAIKDERA